MIYLDEILQGVKTVGITGHIRPDGDCVGSTLGVYNYICDNMPQVDVDICLQPINDKFLFLRNSDKIKEKADGNKIYDLFIVCDCAAFDRFEDFRECFEKAGKTVVFDHHISGQEIGDMNMISPKLSSCSELIYEAMNPDKISKSTAECLYLGIIHDTGVFKYQGVTARTMQIAGKLMEKGIDFTNIIDNTFYMRTYRQSQVLGKALLESVQFCDGRCIFTVLTKRDMEFYCVTSKDLGGVVEQLRLNDTVEVAIFLYETEKNEYKVSMRSKNIVDVSKIAVFFGGGGHVRAAGCDMQGSMYDVINNLTAEIEKQLAEVDKNIGNILTEIQNGVYTPTIRNRLEEIEAQKTDIETKIANEKIAESVLTEKQVEFWLTQLGKNKIDTIEQKRRLD